MVVLFNGRFPGYSPGAKRVILYAKGLKVNGIDVEVVPLYFQPRNSILFYLYRLSMPLLVSAKLIKIQTSKKPVLVYGFGWVSLLLLRLITWIKGNAMILEINEKPYSTYGSRLTEIRFIKWFNYTAFTRLAVPLADGFIVISENLKHWVNRYKSKHSSVIKVPVLVDETRPVPEGFRAPDVPYLVHAGALSERKDGIIGVFKAFARVNKVLNGKFEFYLTDRTAPAGVLDEINRIVDENNLNSVVHFLGHVPQEKLDDLQNGCSMLVLNKPDNEQNRHNFATKLGEYLILAKPVLFSPVGEMAVFLKDNYNAFEIPYDNPDVLADKMLFVLRNPDFVRPIAMKGFELAVTEFSYRVQGERIKLFIETISGR